LTILKLALNFLYQNGMAHHAVCHALVSAQMGLTEHQGLVGAEGLGQATQWEELLQWMVQDGGLDALPAGLGFMQAVGCRLDMVVIRPLLHRGPLPEAHCRNRL